MKSLFGFRHIHGNCKLFYLFSSSVYLLSRIFLISFSLLAIGGHNLYADSNGQANKEQCRDTIIWFGTKELKLLMQLSTYDAIGAATKILKHPQNHPPQILSKAMDAAVDHKLYHTIPGMIEILENRIEEDDGLFKRINQSCNLKLNLKDYHYQTTLRMESAFSLGNIAYAIKSNQVEVQNIKAKGSNDLVRFAHRKDNFLDEIVDAYAWCLTNADVPDTIKFACAESCGNTYSLILKPILLSIINDPNANSTVVVSATRSLTMIETWPANNQTSTTMSRNASNVTDPASNPITPEELNNAMNYIKQFIPNTY